MNEFFKGIPPASEMPNNPLVREALSSLSLSDDSRESAASTRSTASTTSASKSVPVATSSPREDRIKQSALKTYSKSPANPNLKTYQSEILCMQIANSFNRHLQLLIFITN